MKISLPALISIILTLNFGFGCTDFFGGSSGSQALKRQLKEAREKHDKTNDLSTLTNPSLLVKTLKKSGAAWVRDHPGFQWQLEWSAVLSVDQTHLISIEDKIELLVDETRRWRLVHESRWREFDTEPVIKIKRCGSFDGRELLGFSTGPWSVLDENSGATARCLDALGEPFADLLSAFHAKVLLTSRPSHTADGRNTVVVQIDGPEQPEPTPLALPRAWSEENEPTAELKGPRAYLLGQYAAVQSLEGMLEFDQDTTAPLSGRLSSVALFLKGKEKGRLALSFKLRSAPWEHTLTMPDKIKDIGKRKRIFKQREALLGIPARRTNTTEKALPKTGDAPRFIARELVENVSEDDVIDAAEPQPNPMAPQLEDRPE